MSGIRQRQDHSSALHIAFYSFDESADADASGFSGDVSTLEAPVPDALGEPKATGLMEIAGSAEGSTSLPTTPFSCAGRKSGGIYCPDEAFSGPVGVRENGVASRNSSFSWSESGLAVRGVLGSVSAADAVVPAGAAVVGVSGDVVAAPTLVAVSPAL